MSLQKLTKKQPSLLCSLSSFLSWQILLCFTYRCLAYLLLLSLDISARVDIRSRNCCSYFPTVVPYPIATVQCMYLLPILLLLRITRIRLLVINPRMMISPLIHMAISFAVCIVGESVMVVLAAIVDGAITVVFILLSLMTIVTSLTSSSTCRYARRRYVRRLLLSCYLMASLIKFCQCLISCQTEIQNLSYKQ